MSANDNFSLHDDEELSLHDDASLNGSEPASNKGDAPAKPPQIITTNTLSNIKLPVLQKDDYDTWAMEMEHYLEYIDNEVWKVIQNGNSKKRVTKGKDGVYRVLPPTTQEEQVADEKERKARTLLLMAVPKDHLRRFHGMDDAKEIWAAIKTRFGGNANSKKMQKAVLKQQFEAFTISSKESLEKGYDRFPSAISMSYKVSIVMGRIFSIEARDMDAKLLSASESNNTLARCSSLGIITSSGWPFVSAVLGQMAHLIATRVAHKTLKRGFLSSVLLWLVIIVAVLVLVCYVVVVIIVAVVVVGYGKWLPQSIEALKRFGRTHSTRTRHHQNMEIVANVSVCYSLAHLLDERILIQRFRLFLELLMVWCISVFAFTRIGASRAAENTISNKFSDGSLSHGGASDVDVLFEVHGMIITLMKTRDDEYNREVVLRMDNIRFHDHSYKPNNDVRINDAGKAKDFIDD
ncbi:hypothetical protein Tco_0232929 [Tanacetum coccineum]